MTDISARFSGGLDEETPMARYVFEMDLSHFSKKED